MEISEIRLGSTQNYTGNVNKLCKGFNALYLLIKFHKDHVSRPVSHPSLVLQPAHISIKISQQSLEFKRNLLELRSSVHLHESLHYNKSIQNNQMVHHSQMFTEVMCHLTSFNMFP